MCVSKNTVLVNGSFTITDKPFTRYLDNPASDQYKQFVKEYTEKLEYIYSTLPWFDSLQITGLRQGSVIGDFKMMITSQFTSNDLENTTMTLEFNTNATFNLVVTGLVKITKFPEYQAIVSYNAVANLTCHTTDDLGKPMWSIQQNALNSSKDITNGTESKVYYNQNSSRVAISNTTDVWKGTFTCEYKSKQSDTIIFRASEYLDIALLPKKIINISDPQFPNCEGNQKQFKIKVQCIVPDAGENYTVDWKGRSIEQDEPAPLGNGLISYQAYEGIFCDENLSNTTVICKFTNRQNQTTSATIQIQIIQKLSKVCIGDNGWPTAKAGFTAMRLCGSSAVGEEQRRCFENGTWDSVISMCLNRDLSDLLNDAKDLQRGLGIVEKNANNIFGRLKESTEKKSVNSFANVNASVDILSNIYTASKIQDSSWTVTVFPDFVKSSSNLLNGSLNDSWRTVGPNGNYNLAFTYLEAVEGVIKQTNLTAQSASDMSKLKQENLQIIIHNKSDSSISQTLNSNFNVNVTFISSALYVQTAFKNLASKLPNTLNGTETDPSDTILSVIAYNNTSKRIAMSFNKNRLRNHKMYCVFWANTTWSDEGCTWGGVDNPNHCECNHLSAFTILMAKKPIQLLYMDELTYTGLGFSVASLALCLVIEFLVWNAVVKSNIAHFRHTVLVNIMISLLIADCSFFVTHTPSSTPSNWCLTLTVMKHFCYLAVFFWMMCLSLGLLHQVIFVFVHLRKKVYLGLCFFLGYVCPLIIVVVTFISHDNGATGKYYSTETCWLIYESSLKGSIHAFLFPVFIIVFVNMFTMVVVISRILKPTLSEGSTLGEKEVARSIVKTVVLLSPILGITWILGLFVLMLDLTKEPYAQIVNYAFTFFNSFQGFFILLTACFGEKRVRDALLKRLRRQQSVNYKSEISTRMTSTTKIK
ncbi:adhesion G-protein coupled receptor F3-like isoform X1 [Salminus brasiliensis]